MVPYKRVDLAIRVANRLAMPLRVVGDGPLLDRLRRLAGPTVHFEGRVSQQRLLHLYQTRLGLIFPGEEDFGLTPLEAMACGMPVLGLKAGGLLETVEPGGCGEFFELPTSDCLADAWAQFEPDKYTTEVLRAQAERFGVRPFAVAMLRALAEALSEPDVTED
jgi:glycosyltransferase involved in cell wall biosynthesis